MEGSTPIPNLFQLRSTVMGGKVITELDAQGQKKKGYVYCNGNLIARQDPLWIVWQHENPFTGTRGASNREGQGAIDVEPDPVGVNLGLFDPFVEPELWEPLPDGVIGIFPGSGVPSGRCMLDGIAINCQDATHLLHIGAAEFEQPTTVWDGSRWRFVKFNRDRREYETEWSFWKTEVTSSTIDGETSGSSRDLYNRVTVVAETDNLFRAFGFYQSRQRGRTRNTTAAAPQKPIDWAVFQSSLKTCIKTLWEWFEMTNFIPTTQAAKGASNDDSRNGVITINDTTLGRTFSVVNDPTPPPEVQALLTGKARGLTDIRNPFWTYAYPSGDTRPRPGDLRYPELFGQLTMEFVRVQIHEAGAALSAIRNIYHPGPWARRLPDGGLDSDHQDDGPSLEDCVGRIYFQQMGLKPH
jgi:hypothetical protein